MELFILFVIYLFLSFFGIIYLTESFYYWLLKDILEFEWYEERRERINKKFASEEREF